MLLLQVVYYAEDAYRINLTLSSEPQSYKRRSSAKKVHRYSEASSLEFSKPDLKIR